MPRVRRLHRLLAVTQALLLVSSLLAPLAIPGGVLASDPTDPSPSAEPSPPPSSDPVSEPTVEPSPTAEPSPTDPAPTIDPAATSEPSPAESEAPSTHPSNTPAPTPVARPTISSDKPDYAPGELVTLTGANWQPGETVHIYVNDDWGSTWSRNVDVLADAAGEISDQFNLPGWFVANYSVVATGAVSGIARTSFTDGNVKVKSDSGRNFDFQQTKFGSSTNCTTGGGSTTTGTAVASGFTVGVGNNESVRIVANLNANAPSATAVFDHWVNPDGLTITPNLTSRTICVVGFQSGSADLIGVYAAPTNTAPVANGQSVSTNEDAAKLITLGGSDADGNSLTFSIVTGPSHGTLGSIGAVSCSGTAPKTCTADVTYTPAANYNGSDSFTFKVNDGTADSPSATVSIAITAVNDAPSVSLSGDFTSVDEGTLRTYTYIATDVDGDSLTIVESCGSNATYQADAAANSFKCLFTDGPGSTTIDVTASDASTSGNDLHVVSVANVAPDLTAPADQSSDEGSSASFDLGSFSDPGAFDSPWSVDVDWGDGSTLESYTVSSPGALSRGHTYADDGTYTLSVTVTDKDSADDTASFEIVVDNLDPVVTPAVDQGASEGNSTSFNLGSFSDAGVDDGPWAVDVDWGDGSAHTTFNETAQGLVSAKSHTYDDSSSYTVTVKVTDKDGGFDTASFAVTVSNIAPTASLSAGSPVNEGTSSAVSLTSPSDPSGADTSAGFHYSFACDGLVGSLAASYATASTSNTTSCPFDDNGGYSVLARIFDKDGGYSDYLATVTVDNVAPTGTLVAQSPIDEGWSSEVHFENQGDPSNVDTAAGFHYSFACDGLISSLDGNYLTTTGTNSESCTFADNGDYGVAGAIIDKENGSTTTGASVHVNNVAPSVTAALDQAANEGASASFDLGSFSDPGAFDSPWSVDVDWGDSETTHYLDTSQGLLDSANHTYTNNGTYTVTVQITDKDGGIDSASFTVTVSNVPPTITAAASPSGDEGSPVAGSVDWTDPGSADTHTVTIDWGDHNTTSSGVLAAGVATFGANHTYANDGAYTITYTVTDNDGGSDVETGSASIGNVAPNVTSGSPQSSSEGSSASFALGSFSDPGADSPWSVDVDWGDGTAHTTPSASSPGSLGSASHTYDDNGLYTVTVTVTDDDANGSATFSVSVSNVAPTGTLSNDGPVNEGSPATVSFAGQFDPSIADALAGLHYAFDCSGAALTATYATAGTASSGTCTFSDNGWYQVSGRILDKDDGHTDYTTTVVVENVAPTVTAPADQLANEGASTSFSLGSFVDPGADNPWSVDVDWGDGSAHTPAPASSPGSLGNASHTYDDNASYTVTVTVSDKDDAIGSASFTVTVANVAPTASLGNNGPANEGSAATVSFSGQLDPSGADTSAGLRYAFSCSNGDLSGATYATASSTSSTSCTFADGPATPSVKARIIDKDGGYTEHTTTVTVNNVAPTVGALSVTGTGGVACLSGNMVTLGFSWTDPAGGLDAPYAYWINWGDASPATTRSQAAQSVSGLTHTYAAGGPYTISVTVTDNDGGTSAASTSTAFSLLYTTSGILQPINTTGTRSSFKIGSTIPVKLRVTDCSGSAVSGLTLTVKLQKLDNSGAPVNETIVDSVPDVGNTMRFTGSPDNQYIYNLSTKRSQLSNPPGGDLTAGTYRVTVSGSLIASVSADFDTK
jgi:PKD repeat protein